MNGVGWQLEVAQASIREARRLVPEVSLAMVRRVLRAMSPDVDRRMMGAAAAGRFGVPDVLGKALRRVAPDRGLQVLN